MKLRQNFACQVSVSKSLHACCACSLVFAHVFMVFIQIWSLEYSREKEIYPRPIEMSFKQKIQSMSGSLFQTTALDS